ncbi:phosphotransferase, partial [Priestia megaterium]
MPYSWDAELIVSAPLANTFIETQFPDLAPATISLVGSGFYIRFFFLFDRFVFRFPRRVLGVGLL